MYNDNYMDEYEAYEWFCNFVEKEIERYVVSENDPHYVRQMHKTAMFRESIESGGRLDNAGSCCHRNNSNRPCLILKLPV